MRDFVNFNYKILPPKNPEVSSFFDQINIEHLLSSLGFSRTERDLFSHNFPEGNQVRNSIVASSTTGSHSFGTGTVILLPRVTTDERDEYLKSALDALRKFYPHAGIERVYSMRITSVFREIIRNIFDHSGQPGLLAVQCEHDRAGHMQLAFVACDLGNGIVSSVRDYLKSDTVPKTQDRGLRNYLGDFLHWAFRAGYTTKPNSGRNAGLGLPTIKAASKGAGLRLYLLDAKSLVYVTEFTDHFSHSLIRKHTYHMQGKPCFMYFGSTIDLKSNEHK